MIVYIRGFCLFCFLFFLHRLCHLIDLRFTYNMIQILKDTRFVEHLKEIPTKAIHI